MKLIIKAKIAKQNKDVDIEVTITSGVITEIRCLSKIFISEDIETLELPSTYVNTKGNVENVTGIGKDIFLTQSCFLKRGCQIATAGHRVLKLIIPDNITSIVDNAFMNTFIDTVIWPANCSVIPYGCFSESRIKTIQGIENVTEIYNDAFSDCNNLTSFMWPVGATVIPRRCFSKCHNLKAIEGISKVESIEMSAFFDCNSLVEFDWPEACRVISIDCFYKCSNLEKVNINGPIDVIKENAFYGTRVLGLDLSKSLTCNIKDKTVLTQMSNTYPVYQI